MSASPWTLGHVRIGGGGGDFGYYGIQQEHGSGLQAFTDGSSVANVDLSPSFVGGIALRMDGLFLYATSPSFDSGDAPFFYYWDLTSYSLSSIIEVGPCFGIAVNATYCYAFGEDLYVVDVAGNAYVTTVVFGNNTDSEPPIAATPDSQWCLVLYSTDGGTTMQLAFVSASTNTVIVTLTLPNPGDVGEGYTMAISPDSSTLYISDAVNECIYAYDITTNSFLGTLDLTAAPGQIAVTADGSQLVVPLGEIKVYNLPALTLAGTIATDDAYSAVTDNPIDGVAYVIGNPSNNVYVVDLPAVTLADTVTVSTGSLNRYKGSVSPDGVLLWLTEGSTGYVGAITLADNSVDEIAQGEGFSQLVASYSYAGPWQVGMLP